MNILRFYIGKTILSTSIITLLSLAVIRVLFALIDQMGDFGKGDYFFLDGLIYSLLLTPNYVYEFFPMAILIGSIAGLGILSSRSELTVMRAVGKTTGQIVSAALSYGLILIVFAIFLGEVVAPKTSKMAEDLRNRAIYGDKMLRNEQGLWLKDGQQMVHIQEVIGAEQLKMVTLYQFNEHQLLQKISKASKVKILEGGWQFYDGQHATINEDSIKRDSFTNWLWQTEINLEHLSVLRTEPENFNILSLHEYRSYLDANGQDTQAYDLAFWRKLLQPVSTAVMILLAASFIFGPMRTVSMGARVLVGVITGLAYFMAVRAFGPVSLVFGLPAFFGAFLPPFIFAILAWMLLKKAA